MKAFFLMVLLILVFFTIGASSLGEVDLTPDTPVMTQSEVQTGFVPQPQVIHLQEEQPSSIVPQTQPIPITGACTDPYTVQSGDNLSRIAELCNTTVGELRLANPQITNINLIYVGQSLDIPNDAGQEVVSLPVTGLGPKEVMTMPTPTAITTNPDTPLPVTGSVPVFRPGTLLRVIAENYPPLTIVNIGIMPENGSITKLTSGITNQEGSLTTIIELPNIQDLQTYRVVIISTTSDEPTQVNAISDPFFIGD